MGGRSNGIVSEREAKRRKRNRNSDDELENGYFRTPITEERYRSMLCLLYTSPSPRDGLLSRMPSSA